MADVWRKIRQYWWIALALVGTALAVIFRMTTNAEQTSAGPGPTAPKPPTFAEHAQQQVERVRLEGEVDKARITATADAHHAEIDRIEETGKTDPKEARRQLAGFLARNL